MQDQTFRESPIKGMCPLPWEHVPVRKHCCLILFKTDSKKTVSGTSILMERTLNLLITPLKIVLWYNAMKYAMRNSVPGKRLYPALSSIRKR